MNKYLKNKTLNLFIKITIVVLLLWAIYQQVFAKEHIEDIWKTVTEHFAFPGLYWFLAVIVLIPVNWGIEALKWQHLIRNFSSLSFWQTYKAILAGLTVSLFTPNRVGEYGGRILMVKPEHNWKAIIATLVGSFAQLWILLSMGLIGAIYFSYSFLKPEVYVLQIVLFLGILLIAILLFCFFNIDLIIPFGKKLPFHPKIKNYLRHLKVLKNYNSKELFRVLLLSLLRYLTYSFQYYLMLQFFGIEVPFLEGVAGIATIFLLQTSIPLPPLMGLLARGEVALFVWGHFSDLDINILASTFSLFVINLAIPSLLGAVFIIRINVLKSLGYEKEPIV